MASFKDRLEIALRKANMNQETLARLTPYYIQAYLKYTLCSIKARLKVI